jgi:hypothetical protein
MGSDIDRQCHLQQRELSDKIARIESICAKYRNNTRVQALREHRNALIVELHDMKRDHTNYDQRLADAMDDATGQDMDSFDVGESSGGLRYAGNGYNVDSHGLYRECFY